MSPPVIVVHYHELWLKGGNRPYFLNKLASNLRLALGGIPLAAIERPGDRLLIRLREGASIEEARARVERVFGVAYYALARPVPHDLEIICRAAWEEMKPLQFSSFAVRAKRSDKSFPHSSMKTESLVGRYLMDRLLESGREVRVNLKEPEVTCRIEITPGPALVYARKIPGVGGLPANTAGRMLCLLSGGYDSAVAAYHMMRRGAHLAFAHFYGGGAQPGESSLHVARELVRKLVQYQFTARLYRIPFEPVQREIVRYAPERYRILLYRRMMLRIAERLAIRGRSLAMVTGDSLGQVASQTLHNMVAVGDAVRMPVFRPLAGTDKIDIMNLAKKIDTYNISSEPFHDCCPVFMPRMPALHSFSAELEEAESKLDVAGLVDRGLKSASVERFRFVDGRVETVQPSQPPPVAIPASQSPIITA
ncbi:MAG: tRNA uracil 4-sulfurtransferase ThiI [Candidatus Acidiferrales bacterium]